MICSKLDVNHEYQTLREELNQSKKYVFERPLAIAALAIAGLKFVEIKYIYILPFSISLMFIFNFWFTANRLMSGTRIAAYIQLMLEECFYGGWVGWETSLRYYRKWLKENDSPHEKIKPNIDKTAIPDALMYFPPIYYFHFGGLLISVILATFMLFGHFNLGNIIFNISSISVGIFSISIFRKYRPKRMRQLIEENRAIWMHVADYMKNKNVEIIIQNSSNKANSADAKSRAAD